MAGLSRLPFVLATASGMLLYALAVVSLREAPRPYISQEMQVALPRFVQVGMAMGDRYLAANMATWRSLVASTETMTPDNYAIQGRLQVDAAWLNPRQEDNYYVAAAILPWHGQLEAAQYVLREAAAARPFDFLPPFYYAFDIYYFKHDAAQAADVLRRAATRARLDDDRYGLEAVAASWYEKGYSPEVAVKVVEDMAANARSSGFRRFLESRAGRLRSLIQLREAAERFRTLQGRPPKAIDELVSAGLISEVPLDPFGVGFDLDASGQPVFRTQPLPKRAQQ